MVQKNELPAIIIPEKHSIQFLFGKFRISIDRLAPPMKLIGYVYWMIFFHLAPRRILFDKYFSSYDFKIFIYKKFKLNFFFVFFFTILCWINKGVYLCLFEHANTRKSFLSIAAHRSGCFLVF